MKTKSSLLVAVLAAFALPVLAQTAPAPARDPAATPGVDKRQANQQQRIDQGVKSGELTTREAARLEKGQQRIQNMEAKAKADGKVTPRERRQLQRAENRESRKIAREKHDRNQGGKMDSPGKAN